MKILLISGKAEHGKTTTALFLKSLYEKDGFRVLKLGFADYVKFVASQYYGWNGKKDKDGRKLLQYLGTDLIRKNHPDFWAVSGKNLVTALSCEFDVVIIDDTRFPNEVEVFKEMNPFVLRVHRTNFTSSLTSEQKLHASETAMDFYPYNQLLVTESLDELYVALTSLYNNGVLP